MSFCDGCAGTGCTDTHPRLPPRKQSPCHALSSPLPSLSGGVFLRLDELDARKAVAGGGREGEKRLVGLIQLMKESCSRSSCLPLSACRFQHASVFFFFLFLPRGGREVRGNGVEMQQNETMGRKRKSRCARHRVGVGSVLFLLFRAVVGVLLDLGLIINPEAVQTSIAAHTHTKSALLQ